MISHRLRPTTFSSWQRFYQCFLMIVVSTLSIIAQRGGTTTVGAWSQHHQLLKQQTQLFFKRQKLKEVPLKAITTRLFSKDNNIESGDEREKSIPRTTWNCNLQGEESAFWESNSTTNKEESFNEEGKKKDPIKKEEEPRTGWLHYKAPKRRLTQEGGKTFQKGSSKVETKNKSPPPPSLFKSFSTDTVVSSTISTTATKKATEPRTGWLHNTVPKARQKQQQQQQLQQTLRGRMISNTMNDNKDISDKKHLLYEMKVKQRDHRIIAQPAFHANGDTQFVVTEHKISVPIAYDNQEKIDEKEDKEGRIDVYFSVLEIVKDDDIGWWKSLNNKSPKERAELYVKKIDLKDANGLMLYLQGGPGFGSPAPVSGLGLSSTGSWAGKALLGNYYERIILMDQRGTGKSTPITKQWLEKKYPDLFLLDRQDDKMNTQTLEEIRLSFNVTKNEGEKVMEAEKIVTNFMAQFRADNIVLDAEEIKDALLVPEEDNDNTGEHSPRPYGCALGQSFGGFCLMTYLSQIENPPRVCLFTGGIAPMLTPMESVYDKLWDRVKERNLRYYEMFPNDIDIIKKIVRKLIKNPVQLPSGSRLTARRFLQTGLSLGGGPSTFTRLHNLFNQAFLDEDTTDEEDLVFARPFLKAMDSEHSFDDHPIYFLLHESIYANSGDTGATNIPTNWMAHRAYENLIAKGLSEYSYSISSNIGSSNDDDGDTDTCPTLLFGEMVFPWMSEGDYTECSGFGMRCLAISLAEKSDWGPLYDGEHMKRVLADGTISKAAAAVYYEDLYVDFNASMKVTERGAPLEKCKVWVTNEFQHSGLGDNGASIFAKLHSMAMGKNRIPS